MNQAINTTEKALLIKFDQKEHIQALHEKGEWYMNPLPYFWRIDDRESRGDQNDSI